MVWASGRDAPPWRLDEVAGETDVWAAPLVLL